MKNTYKIPFLQDRINTLQGGQNYTHTKFLSLLQNPQVNNSLGCVVGSWIGDTLGSYCEFQPHIVSEQKLNQAMEMKGGGVFNILPGQFTDDSQMSAAMIEGISAYDPSKSIQQQKQHLLTQIAKEYVYWLKSAPFDIGNTCFNAVDYLRQQLQNRTKDFDRMEFNKIFKDIYNMNGDRESNGSLMRMAPMILLCSLLQGQGKELDDLIRSQIQLTHPNKKLIQAGVDWVHLNTRIINRNHSRPNIKSIYQDFIQKQKLKPHNQIQDYIDQSLKQDLMDGVYRMGWAKIAFNYSIIKLRYLGQLELKQPDILTQNSEKIYKDVVRSVLKQGGDTDTNCAIVGSLLGSVLGFKGLPKSYISKIINLNLSQNRNSSTPESWVRPPKYEPRRSFLSVLKLIGRLNPRYKIV